MSSSDVGSYELKRSSCEMQMEECSATLARSTSDGSADNDNSSNNDDKNKKNYIDDTNDHDTSDVKLIS